jgi:hypothetical protein
MLGQGGLPAGENKDADEACTYVRHLKLTRGGQVSFWINGLMLLLTGSLPERIHAL